METTTQINQATTVKRALFRDAHLQKDFETNGYVVLNFLNPSEVDTLQQAYNNLPAAMGTPAFASTIMSPDATYRDKVSVIIKDSFKRALNDTFKNTHLLLGNFNLKYANSPRGTVQMHQDPSFLNESMYTAMVIWVPLIDTTPQNGAIQVIPGSHTIIKQPRCGGRPFPFTDLEQPLLQQFGRQLLMQAGQAYIASPALFHASPPNVSSQSRIAAAGLAGPKESSLRYHHYKEVNGSGFAEIFDADHEYYVSAPLFSRPSEDKYKVVKTVPLNEQLPSRDVLFKKLNSFT